MLRVKSFIIVTFMFFLSLFSFSASSRANWLVNIDDKDVFSIGDFNKEFISFVDLQALSQATLDPASIKEARNNKVNKQMYLENTINDLLILEYAKKKNIYDEKKLSKQIDDMTAVLRKQMIRKYFVNKVIMPKVKVDEALVKELYARLKQMEDTKGMAPLKIRGLARRRAKIESMQRVFASELDKLRSKHRIKLNDKYDSVFE